MRRQFHIDILKALGCILIVLLHVTSVYFSKYGVAPKIDFLFANIIMSITRLAVPTFIIVSGALMLKNKIDNKKLLNKTLKIITVIVIFSVFYLFLFSYYGERNIDLTLKNIVINIVNNTSVYSFWYLYLTVGLYIMTPFLKKMVDVMNLNEFKFFALIALSMSTVKLFRHVFTSIKMSPDFWVPLMSWAIFLYIAGYFLNNKLVITKKLFILSVINLILYNVVTVSLTYYLSSKHKMAYSAALDNENVTVLIGGLSLFIIVKYLFENPQWNNKVQAVIVDISKKSYAIFVLHPMVLSMYKAYLREDVFLFLNSNNITALIVDFIIVFTGTYIITYVLKKFLF